MEYLKGLNEAQKEAVLHTGGPLLIVAGAGAGKTKTITHRIVHLISTGVAPSSILAVTFTNKAAGEMRDRVAGLLQGMGSFSGYPVIATFHSLGVRILREFALNAGLERSFSIWDRDDSTKVIKRALVARGMENRFTARQMLGRISREKGNGVALAEYVDTVSSSFEQAVVDIWEEYEKARQAEGALDFDDLLLQTLMLLKKDPIILKRLQERWRHLTIDEYQDTNKAQFEIARLLAGDTPNICAVGDMDQCIYTWRNADIKYLMTFEKSFPGTKVVILEENYRSTQTILTAANNIISKNNNRYDKRLVTRNPVGEAITLFAGETERDEAFFVAREARGLLGSGVRASEIAVLFRENFQSRTLEEAFIAGGVPYRVLGTRFFERAEVKDALSYLRVALNPRSVTDFVRAAGSPARGIGKTTLDRVVSGKESELSSAARAKLASFRGKLTAIRQAIETRTASDSVRFTLKESGLEDSLRESEEGLERLNNIYELVAHAVRYDALRPREGIERLLEDAALMSDQDQLEEKKEAVSLMTVHASKGLEFDAVFVTGLEQGLFPSERESDTDRDPEEERRLAYVAFTRARHFLFLTFAGTRTRYGSREHTYPSAFLNDIDTRLTKYADDHAAYEPIIR